MAEWERQERRPNLEVVLFADDTKVASKNSRKIATDPGRINHPCKGYTIQNDEKHIQRQISGPEHGGVRYPNRRSRN